MKYAGAIRCYFHNKEGIPRVFIGPDWRTARYTMLFDLLLTIEFLFEYIRIYLKPYNFDPKIPLLGIIMVVVGNIAFWYTLLSNPGIPVDFWKSKKNFK